MNRQEIFDKIQAIVAEYLSIEHENITFDFPLIEPNSNSSCRYWGFSISGDELVAIEIIMALEEEFDVEIPDEDVEKLATVQHAVNYINNKLPTSENEVNSKDINSWIEDFKKKLDLTIVNGKESLSSVFSDYFSSLIETLQISRNKKFVFLLVGRTGVGKSSTINTLMGKEVAPTSRRKPTTMDVNYHENEINGIHFTVVDTPGLCDDHPEKGNDQNYLELIRSKVKQIDLLWFVTPIYETRIRSDELNGIKLISEALGVEIWKHAVIVFTFADKADDYLVDLKERTEDIQEAIATYAGYEIANNIPSVAVDNKNETTPDGNKWLGELYTKVFVRISESGTIPFLLATVQRLSSNNSQKSSTEKKVEFDARQKESIKEKLFSVIPILKNIGGAIGSAVGAVISMVTEVEEFREVGKWGGEAAGEYVGEKVDSAIGSTIKFFSDLFSW
ncbi:MAG: GTPase [Nostoc sp.]|uniref:GTPase n=1 Tax=Nostoc sp. TaxID=1180 RepID=UPI002FF6FDB4